MDEKHLSARLACVASLVPAGARVADIGSDHAYLPAALVLDGKIDFGPFLLENKGPIFKKKWQEYLQREAHVIDQMQKAQQPPVKKINEINEFLSQVKEAIADDNR
ncbi:SAM-dependent methyltransferase [Limosilactobacillus reuteri]|uniref:SAM-dependent methyltransferase n=1 Tax=Limosilactobacillus reuteri TaxID=1598 RepID=UPI001CDC1DB3|nr:SAM-dependent methyltransferase [Limosilactobacillus reuteri]